MALMPRPDLRVGNPSAQRIADERERGERERNEGAEANERGHGMEVRCDR